MDCGKCSDGNAVAQAATGSVRTHGSNTTTLAEKSNSLQSAEA